MLRASAKTITLHDVAAASGVSYQTVSRVINNHPHVAQATRERVLAAIEKLGYEPNNAARLLASGRSRTIGLVSFGTTYYGPAQMVANLERALRASDYGLAVANLPDLTLGHLELAITYLRRQSVDGIAMIAPLVGIDAHEVGGLCQGLPFVIVDAQQGLQVPSVVIDQRHGAQLATEHLLGLGHRRLVEVSGPLNWCGALSRHQAWLETTRRAGLEPGLSVESDWTAAGGYVSVQSLLAGRRDFTAIVFGNDQMALGGVKALREHGLRVPEDVSVVGFDDLPEADYFAPPLTTIAQDFGALGRQSAEYLIAQIEDAETPVHQRTLYPRLVERASTAVPKAL